MKISSALICELPELGIKVHFFSDDYQPQRMLQGGRNADLFMRSMKRHTPNIDFLAELSVTLSHFLS